MAILSVQHFCNFGAILCIVNLLKKRTPLLLVLLVWLSMFVMSHFLGKLQICMISYVNWLDFVYCLKFTSLKPDLSK